MSGRAPPPLRVRAEYVVVDGAEGAALEERQLMVIREVLAWVRRQQASAQEPDKQEPELQRRRAA
jgi:hypothetical protein